MKDANLASRILEVYDINVENLKSYALNSLIDFISVTSVAYHYEKKYVNNMIRSPKGKVCTGCILGARRCEESCRSAVINAFLAHALELDDWLPIGFVHAGSVVIPPLFAFLDEELSIEKVVRAIAVGYESAGVIGAYLGRRFYEKWHTTSIAGSVGATLATLSLLKDDLSHDDILLSIGIALNYSGGLWRLVKARRDLKPFSPSSAVALGIHIGELINAMQNKFYINDITISDICKHRNGECEVKLPKDPLIKLNEFKFFPSCRHTHTSIEAALKIREHLTYSDIDKVKKIEVYTFKEAIEVANIPSPRNLHEARFSIKYLISLAIVYGKVTLSTLSIGLKDPKVNKLMKITEVIEDENYSENYPNYQPSRVLVYTSERVLDAEVLVPLGSPKRGDDIRELLLRKAKETLGEVNDMESLNMINKLIKSRVNESFTEIVKVYCSGGDKRN